MTNFEKRKKLTKYCMSFKSCAKCPRDGNKFCSNFHIDDCSDEILADWYDYFFNDDDPVEELPKTRAEFLKVVEGIICKDRNAQYGEPEDNFGRIAKFWSDYLETSIDAADVAIMMSLFKIARIATGGNKSDNWVDLIGYAACGAECATKREA